MGEKRKTNYNPKSLDNLKPFQKGDPRASEYGRKGYLKKMENLRQRKAMKKVLNDICSLGIEKGIIVSPEEVQSMAELENTNIDVQTAILMSMVQQAVSGDVKAATFVRDTLGEKPKEEVDVSASIAASNKLTSIINQINNGGEELEEMDEFDEMEDLEEDE